MIPLNGVAIRITSSIVYWIIIFLYFAFGKSKRRNAIDRIKLGIPRRQNNLFMFTLEGINPAYCSRETQTVLELCPTSNWLTGAVPVKEKHPLAQLLRNGVRVTINSDDPGVFAVRLSEEYRFCGENLGLKHDEIESVVREALAASFIDPDRKDFYGKKYFEARGR